eukprot:scaffold32607_cov51-Phaeocystis_antarctica.AAC.5
MHGACVVRTRCVHGMCTVGDAHRHDAECHGEGHPQRAGRLDVPPPRLTSHAADDALLCT